MSPKFLVPWARSFAGPLKLGSSEHGIILLHRQPDAWELLGGQDVADRLDALVEPGRAEAFWKGLLQEPWDAPLRLPNLGEDSPLLPLLPALGVEYSLEETDKSPAMALPKDPDEYVYSLSRHQRHELLRKQRRAARLARVTFAERPDVDEFVRLHRLSHSDKEAFMTPAMIDFFKAVAQEFGEALHLAFAEVDGQPAAAMWQIEWNGIQHLYNSGYDPAYAPLTPGVLLIAHCIRSAILRGLREYDFLRGTERYKYDLGGRDRSVYRVVLQP